MKEQVKPNFYCVGVQKAGTTTLFQYLRQHPQIFLPDEKEAHFFDKEDEYSKGLDWYISKYFQDYSQEKIIGTITPSYCYIKPTAERLFKELGKDVKLLFCFRNPAQRAWSHYQMQVSRGKELEPFETAIEMEPERLQQGGENRSKYSYIDRGNYADQVKEYLKYFPRENMLFLIFERQIANNLDQSIQDIFKFLEVESFQINSEKVYNSKRTIRSPGLAKMNQNSKLMGFLKKIVPAPKLRGILRTTLKSINTKPAPELKMTIELERRLIESKFTSQIDQLEELIDIDLSCWRR